MGRPGMTNTFGAWLLHELIGCLYSDLENQGHWRLSVRICRTSKMCCRMFFSISTSHQGVSCIGITRARSPTTFPGITPFLMAEYIIHCKAQRDRPRRGLPHHQRLYGSQRTSTLKTSLRGAEWALLSQSLGLPLFSARA